MSPDALRPQRGDEHQLFERYSERLRRETKFAINTSPEIVDDACAFAWMKLVSNQPERGPGLYPWLRAVARNRALELDRLERSHAKRRIAIDVPDGADYLVPATRGRVEVAQGLLELRERLQELPPRQREVVFLHAAGWRYGDLANHFGVSPARVGHILAQASARMREMDMQALEPPSPRGRRLRDIEKEPPPYIVASIGRQPRAHHKTGGEEMKREWKRLVLAIEDYREANGINDRVQPLGRDTDEPQRDALRRRIAHYRRERGLGIER